MTPEVRHELAHARETIWIARVGDTVLATISHHTKLRGTVYAVDSTLPALVLRYIYIYVHIISCESA
jgi:hypothetical protein